MLLDTCALLWLAQGGGKLSKSARQRIEDSTMVSVSAVSGFEIGLRYRQGKLELPVAPPEWFRIILEHHGVTPVPLSLDIALQATELPLIHRDPCDRFIIATARRLALPVVTDDPRFNEYGVETLC
jgi:PIN domain nuclease of toxin-antitoxin system